MQYFVMSNHVHFVAHDGERLIQAHASADYAFVTIEIEPGSAPFVIQEGGLAGYTVTWEGGLSISLKRDDKFLCAIEGSAVLASDRLERLSWETFYLATPAQFSKLAEFNLDAHSEKARFKNRVEKLSEAKLAVKVYCGCGRVPRENYLNLDIRAFAPEFALSNPDDYFFFDFASSNWPIGDNIVDFIFDEDFIEHIDQITQIQYLAETRRVLKVNSYHRVSTPNFLAAMKRHSDFSLGANGVYTGEREHEHIAMFSPWSLKEVSELVGYREIVFETKNVSVSPFPVNDTRPWNDRDPVLGNIYAELLK
jgi:predicted SAM-dependent methyltransferase